MIFDEVTRQTFEELPSRRQEMAALAIQYVDTHLGGLDGIIVDLSKSLDDSKPGSHDLFTPGTAIFQRDPGMMWLPTHRRFLAGRELLLMKGTDVGEEWPAAMDYQLAEWASHVHKNGYHPATAAMALAAALIIP